MKGLLVVAGSLAQRPGVGGHTWVFLQYLLGFRRLGWEVLFLDRLEPEMCLDGRGRPSAVEDSQNLRYLYRVMREFDLADSFAVVYDGGRRTFGLSRRELMERVRRASFLLNVMGFLDDEEILASSRHRVFLDIDPGFPQMWRELGLADPFAGHDSFVTLAGRIGQPGCGVPSCGLDWLTTRQPVVLDEWPTAPGGREAFTSVAVWRGPYASVDYGGSTYGLRVHEFRKFAGLPGRCAGEFELALEIHPDEHADQALLTNNGWRLVDPASTVGDPLEYRRYIAGSKAELMIAKGMYVHTHGGWISDRSICYLASGKPVLAQDTGLAGLVPCGDGLLTFSTLEEAEAGVEEIRGNYARHARAARELAAAHFDSDLVLGRLTDRLGAG